MFESLMALEFLLLLLLVGVWGITGYVGNHLKYLRGRETRFRGWLLVTKIGVVAGMVLILLWVLDILLIGINFGWLFVMDRVAIIFPLLGLPALAVMIFALPNLSRVIKAGSCLRSLIVPVHVMLVGAVLAFFLVTIDIPAIPNTEDIAMYGGTLIIAVVLLWFYHGRRLRLLEHRTPRLSITIARSAVYPVLALGTALIVLVIAQKMSEFPGRMEMVHHQTADYGGGDPIPLDNMHAHHRGHDSGASDKLISVVDLKGPQSGIPDKTYVLYAETKKIQLASGETIEAWTFNGQAPGPELVANEGDLVEVQLVNKNITSGVTLHWHGVDVPNGEDGVAGMTQDAVMPGESYTYRFVVEETGTHWYHSHQQSSIQVQKGLFGAFIIRPSNQHETKMIDTTIVAHDWMTPDGRSIPALDKDDSFLQNLVDPGLPVRLRLVNAGNLTRTFSLNGTPFKVTAIDGYELNEPGTVTDRLLRIGGGGRYDIEFIMPDTPVTLAMLTDGKPVGRVYSKDGDSDPEVLEEGEILDITQYGAPTRASFDTSTVFDRTFTLILDQTYFGVYNGEAGQQWVINGKTFPNTPTLMVREGDLVKTTFVNRSFADHPMHLHGHHVQVISKNGLPVRGSPLVLDTVNIEPGETLEVAFLANNPGLWMDHCHNLDHAQKGMTMHVAYENVYTPFAIGSETGNHPE
ncbi:MAG: multicopper oxidase domain-containing protein [Paenibacillus sp.]|uniref:multicopper oxidase domain-containing protein n=1 Tax=Paenibacillus sp. TaxID=58172 RepID=UPI0029096B2E|nr:multicopper oxidase domain-containing protein [Paenibacillus sp.]MDU4696321.1 multicopper oxidase domain-containing protein [Paenibacillus sp.]